VVADRLAVMGDDHYPDGSGRSKLRISLSDRATGRNLNTVRKLLEPAAAARDKP
jgi:hypothetical protein